MKKYNNETGEFILEESYALDTFEKSVRREADDRYTVNPLFRKPNIRIRNNNHLAQKRYRALREIVEKDELKMKNIL